MQTKIDFISKLLSRNIYNNKCDIMMSRKNICINSEHYLMLNLILKDKQNFQVYSHTGFTYTII